MASAFREDLGRYRRLGKIEWFEPSIAAIAAYRFGQWCKGIRTPLLRTLLRAAYLVMYCVVTLLTGIDLPRSASIGPGLRIFHFGGIVINPSAVIGFNCTLRQNVCIGSRYCGDDAPRVGDNVDIGVGAVVIGAIRVGNNVRIGANAVVLRDVPDGCIAVGVPARILPAARGAKDINQPA
jgi:serine O-acetyltransferase